ncbi:MAG: helix-turn-helix transcriptional regulator [Corynebacterium flavescens]|uniref:helix-turn-helix transcriptional regulator n=1 Tax=Corynebacterium flavescens TaxID=28028 RepID=UPI003F8E9123
MSAERRLAAFSEGRVNHLLTATETAGRLGIHRTTLQRWARAGYFPRPTYIGRRAFYEPQQISDFINKQRS